MHYALDFNTINLYLRQTVIVSFTDGTQLCGKLTGILPETKEAVIDNATTFSLGKVADMEMIGEVTYHTYAKESNKVCEIAGLDFGLEDFVPGTDYSGLLYGEFSCTAACHLYFDFPTTYAKDVRILSLSHKIYAPALEKTLYMYILRNQPALVGQLQSADTNISLRTRDGQLHTLECANILDIIRFPQRNDYVIITRKDGSEVAGPVSFADEDAIDVILDDHSVQTTKLADLRSIRYRGTVSIGAVKVGKQIRLSLGEKDESFLCKIPYLRNPEEENLVRDGAVATFIPGVSDRGLVAKDVVLESTPAQVEDEETWHYGVLLTVDFTKGTSGVGYIGSRYVTKACGNPVSGNARFLRDMMKFDTAFNRAHIVRYASVEEPDKKLRTVRRMELYQTIDLTTVGIVDVTDDGEITTTPLYQASIDRFVNRDVDVVCTNGETVSGLLQKNGETGITVVQGTDEDAPRIDVAFDEIEDVFLVGTVTQYYQNGTGYVDNAFFFHINEMKEAYEAQFVRPGTQLVFSLRNARKGNFVDCGDIRVLYEKRLDVYVLSYQDKKYTVVDAEKYGTGVRFLETAYQVPYASYNQFRDLANEDYHAILTLVRKAGVMECAYIRTITSTYKLRAGVVTQMDKENNTVTIVPLEHYRKRNEATTYEFAAGNTAIRLPNPETYDYEVLYYLTVREGVYKATITRVDEGNTHRNCYYGYLEKYLPNDSYGFITPEEYFGLRHRPRNYGIYCRNTAFVKPPETEALTDTKYVYRVCYTLNATGTAKHEKPSAQAVWFLEKVDRRASAPAATAAPAASTGSQVVSTENIDLLRTYPPEQIDGVSWYYGMVFAYNLKFDVFHVYTTFQSKKVFDATADLVPHLLTDIPLPGTPIQISDTCTPKINTSRFAYLIRFAATQAEDGTLVYNADYPVDFLREFRKNSLRAFTLADGILHVETGPLTAAPAAAVEDAPTETPAETPEDVAIYHPGETILIKQSDDSWRASVVEGIAVDETGKERVILDDGHPLDADQADVIRFGVLTSFNEDLTLGYLNGNLRFNFAKMESRTFNMVKTAKKQQLLWYLCQDGVVSHVERITGSFLDKLPFQWLYGKVTDYTDTAEKRCIMVNNDIRYLLTVSTGGYIWGLIKTDSIIDKVVFIKVITCPYTDESGTQILQYAMDIHAEQEVALIRYDAVSDRYLAAQNATQSVVVEGSRSALSSMVDSQATVLFRVTEDGRRLQAFIDSADGDPDWVEETPGSEELELSLALKDSPLVQYLLSKVDLTTLQLPEDVTLAPDGRPAEDETAVRLILHLERRPGKDFDLKRHITAISLLMQLPEDLQESTLKQLETRAVEALKQYSGSNRYRFEETLKQLANRYSSVESFLWWVLTRHIRNLSLQNDCLLGEYSYYSITLLRDIHGIDRQKDGLYRLFLQDFYSRIEAMEVLRQLSGSPRGRKKVHLQSLFQRELLAGNARDLVAHMVSLDETACQHLVFNERVFSENPNLAEQVLAWGKEIDSTQGFDSNTVIDHLRALYKADKLRYTKELTNAASGLDTIKHAERILRNISGRFALLLTTDDAQRFSALQAICEEVTSSQLIGYRGYQAALINAWAKCRELLQSAQTQLTAETTEMLLRTGLIEAVLAEIGGELNNLYTDPDYVPSIHCSSNYSEVVPSQDKLLLLVENGDPGHTNLQNAYNVTLHLEVVSGLSVDSIPSQIVLKDSVLAAGDAPVELEDVALDLRTLDGDMFSISVTAEYEYCVGFDNGEIRAVTKADCGTLEFQLRSDLNIIKNENAVNYYLHPADGKPLSETSEDDRSMFFGRKEELHNIWDSIVDENKILREGRAIMLFGQKKCGKTSLINQIIHRLRTDEAVSKQAIIISIKDILEFNGGVTALEDFTQNFYQNILDELDEAICKNHPDLMEALADNGLEIPVLFENPSMAASLFQRFFRQFNKLDQGKHRIVLVMDEFTRLCTTILARRSTRPDYCDIPNFIKLFSSMGFVQIIIGHPNMMRALSELGIMNHTGEFAKRIELSALKEADARALIREPMIRSFGFDVYQSRMGEKAIKQLLDLSGCHPSVLMKLCDRMFQHYITTAHPQILAHDVDNMLASYLPELEASTTFDILMLEDGDAATFFDNLPTYRYLRTVAIESLRSNNRDCDRNIVCQELKEDNDQDAKKLSDETRELLVSRRVLTDGNGRIKIPIQLFVEYIRYKYKTH